MNPTSSTHQPKLSAILEFFNIHNNMALASQFEIDTQIERVWDELTQPEHWPEWWDYVESVELLEAGNADDLNALRKVRWKTALPYQIDILVRTLIVEKPYNIVLNAQGDLNGMGRWQLEPTAKGTCIRYIWCIQLEKPWMRWFAPLLKPVFAWNHHRVMQAGAQGLAQRLNAALFNYQRVSITSTKL